MKALLACFVVVAAVGVAGPASGSPDETANDISKQIMSPFCPGVTLHDCPSQAAVDLRARIERWARAGWSRERIMDKLTSEFGPGIRATPPDEGAGVLVWALPGIALAVGAVIAWTLARRWTAASHHPPPAPVTGEDRHRLAAELAAYRDAL